MDLAVLEKIRKLAIVAMVYNDDLMEQLVLKGGNAIDLIYQISGRASIDIDFSIQDEFKKEELNEIGAKIEKALVEVFQQEEFSIFDVRFFEKPGKMSDKLRGFWGGYRIEFKVVPTEAFVRNKSDVGSLRRNAIVVGPNQKRRFEIDISKFEYCEDKIPRELYGYRVYVYTIEMIILEKIRAICQQIPEYKEIVPTFGPVARARDFFDIYLLMENFSIDLNDERIKTILKQMFAIKKVPISYIRKIKHQREFHRTGYASVKDTVKSGVQLEEFDFYFDYVVGKLETIVACPPKIGPH